MYKGIRKKVAASVNNVEAPEQFEWGKWLRAPESESLSFSKISSSISGLKVNLSFDLPETNAYTFLTKKVKIFRSRKLASFPKGKTIKVFYKLSNSSSRRIKIFDADSGKIIFSTDFNNKSDNTNVIREIKKPFRLSNVNSVKETEEDFTLLNSKTTIPFDFRPLKPELIELPLVPSSTKTIDIIAQIKKPESKSYLNEIYFYLERSISEQIYQPVFKLLNKIPIVSNFDIPNVNQLIEQLDKDETSKKTNIVSFQFLNKQPRVQKVKILSHQKPEILDFSNQMTDGNKISTYTYLYHIDKTKILRKSFEEVNKGYLFENWNLPFNEDNNALNPQHKNEENENIAFEDTLNEEAEKVNNDASFEKIISNILKPGIILPEKVSVNEEYLYSFQKEGAELLASNKNVLLCDESGLGKSYQAIAALKTLYIMGAVNKILIVCNPGDIGDNNFNEGWAGKLNELQAGIPFTLIHRDDEEDSINWGEKNLSITSYDTFFKYLSDDNSNLQVFEKFNCVIFDEAQNLISNQMLFKHFLEVKRKVKPYIWFLSDQLNFSIRIKKELNFLKNTPIIELGRTKTETYRELPNVVRQDVWHELDEEQKIEYENILSVGRERITRLLQNGNPLIIQSNVFTLLHQLKQIYNFASQKNSSAKSKYLLQQIENAIENDKKILVFSQYDKMGIQKIEQVLNSNKIKYIMLHSGMSLNELETAKKKFQSNKKIHVLLNGIKTSRSGISLPEVQYVVHFDQWWNPATVWKGEASISSPTNENINVYNYFTKKTLEEKIKGYLQMKGLLRKDIIEFLSAESINEMISLDEWLEILGISNSSKDTEQKIENEDKWNQLFESKLKELSIDELSKKTEILFSRLGYKNLSLTKGNSEGEINIIGTILENNNKIKMVAKCLFSSELDVETITTYIETFKNDKNQGKNFIIHFNGLEEKLPYHLKKEIILINKDLFINYLINFRLI